MKLVAPKGRVIIKIDLDAKKFHSFSDGTKIRIERQYNNFNMRYVKPVNATVVSAHGIEEGSDVLIHHNSTHDTYKLFNYQGPTEDASSDIKYYSIPEQECFFWRKPGDSTWNTLDNFVTALRVFKPYEGTFEGIQPTLVKNKLYITSGKLSGKVCQVVNAADYQVIFQGNDGTEQFLIRIRHYEKEYNEREEVIAVDHELTEMVKKGNALIGYTPTDAKKIN
jgi:hypothetical protein